MSNMLRQQDSNRSLLNWVLDFRSLNLDLEGEHRPVELCQHISVCYSNLSLPSYDYGTNKVEVIKPSDIDIERYVSSDSEYREIIKEFYYFVNNRLHKYVSGVYLIGSLATLDYKKGWSDLDVFMVVKDSVVSDVKKLCELKKDFDIEIISSAISFGLFSL